MTTNTPGARLDELVQVALANQARVDQLTSELEDAQQALNRILRTDLPELLTEIGIDEVKLPDGTKITLTTGIDASIPDDKKSDAFVWMVENGYGALVRSEVKVVFGANEIDRATEAMGALQEHGMQAEIKMQVPPPTLKAWAKERLMAGEVPPPALFNVRAYDMARIKQPSKR